jgi:hypothetical protein
LESFEEAREGVGLRWRHVGEQPREPLPQGCLRGTQCPLAVLAEGERLPSAVVVETIASEHAGTFERGKKLRDRRRRDGGAACELRADDLAVGDRLQRQVLRDGEGWLVGREQPLDPAADQWRRTNERLRRLTPIWMMTRPWK